MFVPKAPISAASFRNRRRQRAGSDEYDKLPKAKRQRSTLPQKSFQNTGPDVEIRHGHQEHSVSSEKGEFRAITSNDSNTGNRLAIRGPRNSEQRQDDINGAAILTKTDHYVISQLPALPDQFRGLQSEPCRCFFGNGRGYALAVTHSHAVVWPYSTRTAPSLSADTYTVPIPELHRDSSGPVPLGVLLSTATAAAPGLLIIIPSTGKILYWESVCSAASLGLSKQRQSGILGSVPGLFSGEYAKDIINGEPSGVIVTFSSGRVAHIAIRDAQGKPCVIASFLRNTADSTSTGLFAGIRNALGGYSWRRDVAAVRTALSHQRGQRDIIVATSTGLFEVWDTHWHNGSVLKGRHDVAPSICNALRRERVDEAGQWQFRVLDFVFPAEQHINNHGAESSTKDSWSLLVLAACPRSPDSMDIWVSQVKLSGEESGVISTHYVGMHDATAGLDRLHPRLFLSGTGETAFVLIGQSITMLSLVRFEGSPTWQSLIDPNRPCPTFQDSIHFRRGEQYEILGYGFEDKSGENHSSAMIMVRGFGVIRFTAFPCQAAESAVGDAQVTAKSKLEQAVFYGSMLENPLDLVSNDGLHFPPEEIEQAALSICRDLLRSSSIFISNATTSLEQHLRRRAKALDDLISLLLRHGKQLSHLAWWELLWGAEKLAAQNAMWKTEEGFRNQNEPTLLTHVIGQMNDKYRTKTDPRDDQNDLVQHWFIHDSHQMEHVIPWICNSVKPRKGLSSKRGRKVSQQILQASELSLAILETAFRYRERHAKLYSFNEGILEDGVLAAGYEDLPEFWTSTSIGYAEIGYLLDFELDNCRAWLQQSAPSAEEPGADVIRKIAQNSARHLRVLNQMHRERVHWLSSREDPKIMDEGIVVERTYAKRRKWRLFKLAGIGQLEDAIDLAETFGDMGALVELIIELQDQTRNSNFFHISSGDISDVVISDTGPCAQKISFYFEKFGESWADAFFSRQISMGQSGVLLAMRKFQPFITRFLRKTPAYSRLSWINDVTGEDDYNAAAQSLESLAIEEEPNIWNHHVELSLAKLARLAAFEKVPSADHSAIQRDVERLDSCAMIDDIQEMAYEHILPVLYGAIDQKAGIELAIKHFGKSVVKNRPSLHELLGDALVRVITRQVVGVDQLVDLLTLIDSDQNPESNDSEWPVQMFFLALRVVDLSCYREKDTLYQNALQKLVWRRCMIKDNWEAIVGAVHGNGTNEEFDSLIQNTALCHTLRLCLTEGANNRLYRKLFTPSEILRSTSDFDLLSSRFESHQRPRIIHDLEEENELLRRFIEKGNLEIWFKNLSLSAQATADSHTFVNTIEKPRGP